MSQDRSANHRRNTGQPPLAAPQAPPLPAPQPRPLQRARDAASRFLGYSSRAPSPHGARDNDRFSHGGRQFMRAASLSQTQNATTSHKTGLELRTISINESGSHAIIAGKEIFKTIRIEDGRCAEDFNLRTAIRSTPTTAAGQPRHIYSIDIADVAWAKGDTGNFVAAATSSGKIIVYDLGHAGLQAAQLHEHFRHVHNVTFNPHQGSLLLSGSQDGTVRLWDIRDVRHVQSRASMIASKRKYSGQSEGVRDVKWSPTEGLDFAFATDGGEIQRWDMRNLTAAKVRIPAHMGACNTVDWHPDGKHIVSAGSDKTMRVFDVSASRPRKAAWEIKTPHAVMNARWRPSCQSLMPQDNGAGLCTQVVAAYDREHPVLHIWDLRRPLLPFREMSPYPSAPTDLLWHSQDLLWTVGREGTFLQTDIHHTSKVIDRCNLQALAVSPLGELTFVAQTRKQRRVPKPQPQPLSSLHPQRSSPLSTSPDTTFLSRSLGDDSLDEAFLSALPIPRPTRTSGSGSGSGRFSILSTPARSQNHSATIKLDDILVNRMSFIPQQTACRGQLPSHNNRNYVAYVAKRINPELPVGHSGEDFIKAIEETCSENAGYLEAIGFLQASQTWKIVSFCLTKHLKERTARRRKPETSSPVVDGKTSASIENLATKLAAQHLKSPVESPASMRPMSTITQQLAMPESTSNVPTPLARPSENGKNHTLRHQPLLPELDKDDHMALPPSLASAHASPPRPDSSEPSEQTRRPTISTLADMQGNQSYAEETERNEMVKRWSNQSKNFLDLDPVDVKGVKIPPAKLENHGSGESFRFLEDSAGSRGPSFPSSLESAGASGLPMVAAHPTRQRSPRPPVEDAALMVNESEEIGAAPHTMFFNGSGILSAVNTRQNSGNTSMEPSHEDLQKLRNGSTEETDFPYRHDAYDVTGHDPVLPPSNPAGSEGIDLATRPRFAPKALDHDISTRVIDNMLSQEPASPTDSVIDAAEVDLEDTKPWTLIEMLKKLIEFYTTDQVYPQMAALLLLLLGPLLPRTHPLPVPEIHKTVSSYVDYFVNSLGWDPEEVPNLIQQSFEQPMKAGLQPLQVESILSTYHEQLLRHQLFEEAALLRKLAYPAYPAVYEDFLLDNGVHLMCGQCSKPMSGGSSPLRCQSCRSKQDNCPVCWMGSSPYENEASKLFTSCLLCGHSGHAACLREWFVSCGGDGCPTVGCLCDCVDGPWRQEKTAAAAQEAVGKDHRRVKSDEWKAQPSKAVSGARKELSK
ncbi:uncharacterized protein MYCFIDRAFT_80385 [Pseudocercospora fijiensis CIRAD86]|uniref:Uncharacterized protein n=1 Tax=Pseudocercospora fijiensis (strain CIRAD86) TaxID=383855 RepID=M3B053_PSEFD|nr:uncharacterized protein MYCFIDRAFT_80385 [Pseudocercospora fijiensis CIRAD86]EME82778.1 hypothetical protein MYCFIDRAFT_80385 [Pseudocercospora fijiensis CIRAD86]